MERSEAEGKLRHYHADFGDWIYTATVEDVRAQAQESRDKADGQYGETKINTLRRAVQLTAVADCLEAIGDDRPEVPDTRNVRSLDVRRVEQGVIANARVRMVSEEDMDMEDSEGEFEVFNMIDLTTRAVEPRFKRGDRAWTCSYDERGFIDGYLPVIIVGLELYPDEVMYMWGTYDEFEGTIHTNFEAASDEEMWAEMPETLTPHIPVTKKRESSHLSVVK